MLIFGQVMSQNGLQNSNYSIYGYTLFGHNSAIFCLIRLNFFWQLRRLLFIDWWWEIIILMLSWKKIVFLAGKWRGRHRGAKGFGASRRPKSWPTGWTFWVKNFRPERIFFILFYCVEIKHPFYLDMYIFYSFWGACSDGHNQGYYKRDFTLRAVVTKASWGPLLTE